MINVLVSFNVNQVQNFLDNFVVDSSDPNNPVRLRTDFSVFQDAQGATLDPYDDKHLWVNLDAFGLWKERDEPGPAKTVIVSMYVKNTTYPDPSDQKPKLSMVDYLRDFFDGRFKVIGAWHSNGIPHGQWYDENGDIVGNTTYPLHNSYLDWMPDDNDGSPATEFKQVNTILGHGDRIV